MKTGMVRAESRSVGQVPWLRWHPAHVAAIQAGVGGAPKERESRSVAGDICKMERTGLVAGVERAKGCGGHYFSVR